MSYKERKIEKVKNGALVVLFLLAILLLFLLWTNNNGSNFGFSDLISNGSTSAPELGDLLEPDLVLASDEGCFTPVTGAGLSDVFEGLGQLTAGAGVAVSEISESQYGSYVADFYSVQFVMNGALPLSDLCTLYSVRSSSAFEQVGNVDIFVLSEGVTNGIVVRSSEGKCFCISGESETSILKDISAKLQIQSDTKYKLLNTYVDGAACIPVLADESTNNPSILYRSEAYKFEESSEKLAEAVFGETFDFVRKITDSFGNITYMYGYGQKNLTANKNGNFVYEEETETGKSSFSEDLNAAVNFISNKGGWKGLDGSKNSYKLCAYSEQEGLRTFTFNQIQGSLCVNGYNAFSITVEGGNVKHAERQIVSALVSVGGEESSVNVVSLLQSNSGYIKAYLTASSEEAAATTELRSRSTSQDLAYVAAKVRNINLGYYTDGSSNSLVPVWKVKAGSYIFYFDLNTLEPLGAYKN